MSVLKKLQGKFESVQQDLSAGIKSLRTVGSSKSGTSSKAQHVVTYHAGSDLLNRYQETWFSLHTEMESSAVEAQTAAAFIVSTASFVNKEHQLVARLHEELVAVPSIVDEIVRIANTINLIEELGRELERSLVHLENCVEEIEMTKEKKLHLNQLEVYRLRRSGDEERMRVELANAHGVKVKQAEMKRQAELSERHVYFEEAFNQDLELYRIFGQLERRQSTENSVDLADITLDSDRTELDQFLDNVEGDTAPTDQPETTDPRPPPESGSDGEDSGIHDSPSISPQTPQPPLHEPPCVESTTTATQDSLTKQSDSATTGDCSGHNGARSNCDQISDVTPAQ